jgi:O-antigen/teichoic acid export membrane protein
MHSNASTLQAVAGAALTAPAKPSAWARAVRRLPGDRRLLRNTGWSVAGAVFSRGSQMIAFVIVARLLGKTRYGELGIIQATVGMFSVLAAYGFGLTATKYVAHFRRTDPERVGRIVMLSAVVSAIAGFSAACLLAGGAGWLARVSLAQPALEPLLQSASPLLFFGAIGGVCNGALAGLEAFRLLARVNLLSGVSTGVLTVALTYWSGLRGAVWAGTLSGVALCLISGFALHAQCQKHGIPLRNRQWWKEGAVLFHFSVPAVLAGLVNSPAVWAGGALLARCPDGYGQLGLFNAANTFRGALMFLPMMVAQAAMPALSSAYADGGGERREFRRTLATAHNQVNVPSVFLGTAAMFLAPVLVGCFGREYSDAAVIVIGLMASVTIQALGCAVGAAIQAKGDMWFALTMNVAWGIAFVAVVLLSVARFGAASLAFANAAAYLLLLAIQVWRMRDDLPHGMAGRIGACLGLTAVAAGAACSTVGAWPWPALAVEGAIASLAAAWSSRLTPLAAEERS